MVNILKPFIFGLLIASLLNGFTGKIEKILPDFKHKRVVASIMSVVFTVAFVVLFLMVIIPQMFDSLMVLVDNSQIYLKNLSIWLSEITIGGEASKEIIETLNEYFKSAISFVSSSIPVLINKTYATVSGAASLFLSLCIAVYFLIDKNKIMKHYEEFTSLLSKNIKSFLDECILTTYSKLNSYFSGRVIDSTIIGILCLILMLIFKFDFALLISVIVGITNILPVIGPFIGGGIGAIILLLVDPIQAFWFLPLILIIQQLDGNVIGPKIMGDSMGLSSLGILFAIVLGGGLYGF